MQQRIYIQKRCILMALLGLLLLNFFIFISPVFAKNEGLDKIVTPKIKTTAGEATFTTNEEVEITSELLAERVGNVVQIILSFVSVIFFLFVFYGGLLWMNAQGNEEKVTKAKKLIVQSAVALLIIVSSYLITLVVTNLAAKTASGDDAAIEAKE